MQIVGKPGFRYAIDFERPPAEIIKAFKDLIQQTGCLTGNVGDSIGRDAAMHGEIRNIGSGMKAVGPALTVKVPPTDNLMIHKALTLAKPGDVMVIDGGGYTSHALLGALMVHTAMAIGMAGMIVNGGIRDAAEIREMGFPLFARGVNPNGPSKEGPGEINFPISCGGRIVNPGDLIVADDDGVVVVPRGLAEKALQEARAVIQKEAARIKEIKSGIITRPGLDDILKAKGLV
jgi:4-hydroxy-4-methyl-2-oxoglutarate aldolase